MCTANNSAANEAAATQTKTAFYKNPQFQKIFFGMVDFFAAQ